MIVIVTGSRDFADEDRNLAVLARAIGVETNKGGYLIEELGVAHLYEGGARGLDTVARRLAGLVRGCELHTVPADWALGRSAGPRRNQEMLDQALAKHLETGLAIRAVAFPGPRSVGTWDMVRRCAAGGVRSTVWSWK